MSRRLTVGAGRRLGAAGLAAVLVLAAAGIALGSSTSRQWTIDASPASGMAGNQVTVTFSVQNTGSNSGGDEMTCVRLSSPTSLSIDAASVVSVKGATSGHGWVTVISGSTVAFKNPPDKNPLVGMPTGDKAVFSVTVTPLVPGVTSWTADAADKPGTSTTTSCGGNTFP